MLDLTHAGRRPRQTPSNLMAFNTNAALASMHSIRTQQSRQNNLKVKKARLDLVPAIRTADVPCLVTILSRFVNLLPSCGFLIA